MHMHTPKTPDNMCMSLRQMLAHLCMFRICCNGTNALLEMQEPGAVQPSSRLLVPRDSFKPQGHNLPLSNVQKVPFAHACLQANAQEEPPGTVRAVAFATIDGLHGERRPCGPAEKGHTNAEEVAVRRMVSRQKSLKAAILKTTSWFFCLLSILLTTTLVGTGS